MLVKNVLSIAIIATISVVGLSGCEKYSAGPDISFRSAKERVSNTWKVEQYFKKGADYTFNVPTGKTITYEPTGSYYERLTGSEMKGAWVFANDQKDIKLTLDNGISVMYTIKKLEEKKLWLFNYDTENVKHEWHLIPVVK